MSSQYKWYLPYTLQCQYKKEIYFRNFSSCIDIQKSKEMTYKYHLHATRSTKNEQDKTYKIQMVSKQEKFNMM